MKNSKKCIKCNKTLLRKRKTGMCLSCYNSNYKKEDHYNYNGGFPKCLDCGISTKDYHSKRCRKCYGKSITGNKHPHWKGGENYKNYHYKFNGQIKSDVRNRAGNKCFICNTEKFGKWKLLDVHHIDYNKLNNSHENLVALCRSCHVKTNFNRERWIEYFEKSKDRRLNTVSS